MHIFKSRVLTWWQVGALKISLISLGIAIGARWSEAFSSYIGLFILIAVVFGAYVGFVWFKQEN